MGLFRPQVSSIWTGIPAVLSFLVFSVYPADSFLQLFKAVFDIDLLCKNIDKFKQNIRIINIILMECVDVQRGLI